MPADVRRVSFLEDKPKSGSSRSSNLKSDSAVGSSSTSSSYSAAHQSDRYDPADSLYEVHALKDALADAVNQAELWRAKAHEIGRELRKDLGEAKSRVKALEAHCTAVDDEKKQLQRELTKIKDEFKSLKAQNASLHDDNDILKKKAEKQPATPSSPDSGKLQRSESRRSQESDSDKEKSRLKERFVPRNENSSESSSSKRSSSRAPRGSRRMSTASYADRSVYVEPWEPGAARTSNAAPVSSSTATGGRRLNGYVATSKTGYPAISTMQDPVYSATPRSIDRPSVLYAYADAPTSPSMGYEDGNYHAYPLPPRR